jgi:phytoene dehydrogenase-like protein
MSVIAEWFPGDAAMDDVARRVTQTVEASAPGFVDLVIDRQVITPADIERDYGARGGHPMHSEVDLSQWFEWRPLHGLGRYRMPLTGMYLAGSGAHPGGGVTGAPGRLAAAAVVSDLRLSGGRR